MEPLHLPAHYMSAHDVARTLGIGLSGVRELRRRGRLTAAGGTDRQPYYDTEQVLDLLEARRERLRVVPLDSRSTPV